MDVYLDKRWGIIEYFKEQRRLGRIKHLGFSCHATTETLKRFLEIAGKDMEFCQIQLNWMDWTLQDAKGKCELLNSFGIPIWVMEPVRGGKLCSLKKEDEEALKALRPDESIAAWGFRFVQDIPGVTLILSGMSREEQVEDNLKTFGSLKPLSEDERELLLKIAEGMKSSVPCTACGYCMSGCPLGLDIPMLISTYNELNFAATTNTAMRIELSPVEKQPSACIACGKCSATCPQKINVPEILEKLCEKLDKIPKWREVCKQRELAAKSLG